VQFCANEPEQLLAAALLVQDACDGVDLNLGCPQRIARRGNYGAFLMDDLPRVRSLVETLAAGLRVPVTCKIRLFPEDAPWPRTVAYARMLQDAGCQLLAVHGRTRDMKDTDAHRADWAAIRDVVDAGRLRRDDGLRAHAGRERRGARGRPARGRNLDALRNARGPAVARAWRRRGGRPPSCAFTICLSLAQKQTPRSQAGPLP
jgi:hypothetical protein